MKQLVEAAEFYLPGLVESISDSWSQHPFLAPAIVAAIVWLALTATRAIVGEYVKMLWFRWVSPTKTMKAKKALKAAATQLEIERQEFSEFRNSLSDLLNENDRLLRECLYWRALHRMPLAAQQNSNPETEHKPTHTDHSTT